jgi:hypothetical protein
LGVGVCGVCVHLYYAFRNEREIYYGKIHLSLSRPNECISIIIDGMDQQKTSLPHVRRMAKVYNVYSY